MPLYSNSSPFTYTVVTFNEELDVTFTLKGAGGGGGGHPDDVDKDYSGGNGTAGDGVSGTIRVNAGDKWNVYVGGGGLRGLSWYLGGLGGLGGPSKGGYHGGAGGRQGTTGQSSGGGGGGGASLITINGSDSIIAAGGGGGGGEGANSSGGSGSGFSTSQLSSTTYGGSGATAIADGGGGGGGGGGLRGGAGGAFGENDTGGRGGYRGESTLSSLTGPAISIAGGHAGGLGGSGDITNNTNGGNGSFTIDAIVLPTSRYKGIYTKDAGTWKQPVPSVKYNGSWTQIQEGYVKNNGSWVKVYPPKVSVDITDYNVSDTSYGSPVAWNNSFELITKAQPEPTRSTPNPFVFSNQFNLAVSTPAVSNTVTISGINVPVTITAIYNAYISINGNAYVVGSTPQTIVNGDTVSVRLTSASSKGVTLATVVTAGGRNVPWEITTVVDTTTTTTPTTTTTTTPAPTPDTTPDTITFTPITNSLRSVEWSSNTVTITGINTAVTVTPGDGVSISKNGSSTFSTTSFTVQNTDTIRLKATSPATFGASSTFGITVGQSSATWSISTRAGADPVARNITWSGAFNSNNQSLVFALDANTVSSGTLSSARVVVQPAHGSVTINGTTATYTPTTNAARPGTLSDGQAQTYVDYWTDLFPNGIKSTIQAKSHWTGTGLGESRFIPQIFAGSDSFTWSITDQYGTSNTATCAVTFCAPSSIPLDDVGPAVTSFSPLGESVSAYAGIAINFNEECFPGTGTITLSDSAGSITQWTNGTARPSGQTISLSPGKLKSNSTYTVTVPSGYCVDRAGNNSQGTSWTFKTTDSEGPYVIGTRYNAGQIILTWNEPVNIASGQTEIFGPYYYSGDYESVSHGMSGGPATNQTTIFHGAWGSRFERYGYGCNNYYWGNRAYSIDIESGAVVDYSGNPNEYTSTGFNSDNFVRPAEVAVVASTAIVGGVIYDPIVNLHWGVNNIDIFTGASVVSTPTITNSITGTAADLIATGGVVDTNLINQSFDTTQILIMDTYSASISLGSIFSGLGDIVSTFVTNLSSSLNISGNNIPVVTSDPSISSSLLIPQVIDNGAEATITSIPNAVTSIVDPTVVSVFTNSSEDGTIQINFSTVYSEAQTSAVVNPAITTTIGVLTENGYSGSINVAVEPIGAAGAFDTSPSISYGSGGNDYCVAASAYVPFHVKTAGELVPGDQLVLLGDDRNSTKAGQVTSNRISINSAVTLVSKSGIRLTCSTSTPLTLEDGTMIKSPDALGHKLPVEDENGFRWEEIVEVINAGNIPVALIYCQDQCYAAGDEPNKWIWTHNISMIKGLSDSFSDFDWWY
jgi:hypothetical protein